jgi:glycogen debranching enzyme
MTAAGGSGGIWHAELGDLLVHQDRFYILATSSLAEGSRRVLKHADTFAVYDLYGDIKPVGRGEEGLYHEGTRHLASWLLRFGAERPLYLSSHVDRDNLGLTVHLTNPDLAADGRLEVPRGTLHLERTTLLHGGCAHERWRVRNFGAVAVAFELVLHFGADFADIFEVRGMERARRGTAVAPALAADRAELGYRGLDGVLRRTRVRFAPPPAALGAGRAGFRLELEPGASSEVEVTVACANGEPSVPAATVETAGGTPTAVAHRRARDEHERLRAQCCGLHSSSARFDEWVARSLADLRMMTTPLATGLYPYAGVPWYSTVFGRDGLITALECLWAWPELARGVLAHLAAEQALDSRAERDAEPGKILHEARGGEMAALGEVPFGRYYGSVDSTPLFVLLAGEYWRRTADLEFAAGLWPAVARALQWLDGPGDADGDGFVDYRRRSADGLVNQGWKDSHDAVFHADGSPAEGPIALCEVQAYVFAARRRAAELASALGLVDDAARQLAAAERLRLAFEERFWSESLGTYALALDGARGPCLVRTSNAGHCLMGALAAPERAERIAAGLLGPDLFSGWGVRTLAVGEPRYNPMSYHDGSVWPHDNALVARGLARYGFKDRVARLFAATFDLARHVELHRLPELVCGFERRDDAGPTLYPVACAPQAWASGAVLMMLQACLGLDIDAPGRSLRFLHPALPPFLDRLTIEGLRVADATVDLELIRHPTSVGVNLVRRSGRLEILTIK